MSDDLVLVPDSSRGCVARLSFCCPLKGHYCLYAKSSFNLSSRQPHLWIHIMLLHLQVRPVPAQSFFRGPSGWPKRPINQQPLSPPPLLPPPQGKSSAPLCSTDEGVRRLASLWERAQLKGAHSFLLAVTQQVTPQGKVGAHAALCLSRLSV